MLGLILLFTFLGSVVSLVGGILLLIKEKWTLKISHFLMSFAAGVLLGTAFFDLLPEALETRSTLRQAQSSGQVGGEVNIFAWALVGIVSFFLLERFVYWFHHHHEHEDKEAKPTVSLIILGDSVHNFIDGVIIAATFLVSVPLGIVTALAVAAHEIPQEIGDFAILLHRGMKKNKVLIVNILSALTAMAGAVLTFLVGESVQAILPIIISLTAGFFIYIAASDLIPEIHHEKRGFAFFESLLLVSGVVLVWLSVSLFE